MDVADLNTVENETVRAAFLCTFDSYSWRSWTELLTFSDCFHDYANFQVLDMTKRRLKEVKVTAASGHQKRLLSEVKIQWVLDTLQVVHEDFSTNFIAAYKDDEAEVLTTTAHFHKSHFHFNQKDNVCYNRLPTHDLKRNYLLPLNVSSNII